MVSVFLGNTMNRCGHKPMFVTKSKSHNDHCETDVGVNIVALAFAIYNSDSKNSSYEIHSVVDKLTNSPGNVDTSQYINYDDCMSLWENCRDYFEKKTTMRALKGKHLSQWEKKVNRINQNPSVVPGDCLTVISTLPEIYYNNLNEDSAFLGAVSYINENPRVKIPSTTIKYICRTQERGTSQLRYFFKDDHGYVYYLPVTQKQPSICFIEALCQNDEMTVQGFFQIHQYPRRQVNVLTFTDESEILAYNGVKNDRPS